MCARLDTPPLATGADLISVFSALFAVKPFCFTAENAQIAKNKEGRARDKSFLDYTLYRLKRCVKN